MNIRKSPLALAGLLLLASGQCLAQASDMGKGWTVNLGWFLTDWDTNASLNGSISGMGSNIDFEQDLALDNSTNVFRLEAEYRFNQKHRIDFTYFDINRGGTATSTMDINWGDQTYPAGTVIDTSMDISFYQFSYTYAFLRRENWYLGALIGLHVSDAKLNLNAPTISANETGSATAPLPVIGLRGQYDFTDKWTIRGNVQAFALSYNDFDGHMYDTYIALDYNLFKKVAVGLAYNDVRIDIDVSDSSYNGSMDWNYRGPFAYVKFDFN